MRVKLLNNGSYVGLQNVNFPVVVEAEKEIGDPEIKTSWANIWANVSREELIRVGADPELFETGIKWPWVIRSDTLPIEAVIIEE